MYKFNLMDQINRVLIFTMPTDQKIQTTKEAAMIVVIWQQLGITKWNRNTWSKLSSSPIWHHRLERVLTEIPGTGWRNTFEN